MPRYRTLCIDLKMPLIMLPGEFVFANEVPRMDRPEGSSELFIYEGVGVDVSPYLRGVRSGYTFIELSPIYVVSEDLFILRFIFGDGTTERTTDPLSVVRRKMYVNWLDYYLEALYNARKVVAYEAPHAQGGKFLTVVIEDLVRVVDDAGAVMRGPAGNVLNMEGSLSFDRDIPELALRPRTGI